MTEKPSVGGEARKKRHEALYSEKRRYCLATGLCRVHGNRVMVIVNDSRVKAGACHPINTKKHLRAQNIAEEAGIPCIYVTDSAGAFLYGREVVFDHLQDRTQEEAKEWRKGQKNRAV